MFVTIIGENLGHFLDDITSVNFVGVFVVTFFSYLLWTGQYLLYIVILWIKQL